LFYQIAVHGRNELGLAPDEYAGFSMTLLRMLAFRPVAAGAAGGNAPGVGRAQQETPAARSAPVRAAASVATAALAQPTASAISVPASPAASGRAAALQAARAGAGKSSPRPVSEPVVLAPAVPAPAVINDIAPPWDDAPSTQKKTPAHLSSESMDSALAANAIVVAPAPSVSPATLAQTAMVAAELGWDGNWPQLAADLSLRGMVQQMAQQSELLSCEMNGNTVCFRLRIPVETLRSSGNVEKLTTVLEERFQRTVRIETEIGSVADTANARSQADRAERQRGAEMTMQQDPFVQVLMREFGASIVPGSVRPL